MARVRYDKPGDRPFYYVMFGKHHLGDVWSTAGGFWVACSVPFRASYLYGFRTRRAATQALLDAHRELIAKNTIPDDLTP